MSEASGKNSDKANVLNRMEEPIKKKKRRVQILLFISVTY